jgi:hypothetical protein
MRRSIRAAGAYYVLLCASITSTLATDTTTIGNQKPDGEFALISLDVETLVPVTTETIWQTTCRGQLSVDERRDWGMLLDSGKVTITATFNFEKVRAAVRLGPIQYYLDKTLAMIVVSDSGIRFESVERIQELKQAIASQLEMHCKR